MARTAEQYRKLLFSFIPKGFVWSKDPNSVLGQILYGLSDELVRVEARVEELFDEKDTRTTEELLEEHERDFGGAKDGEETSSITSERQEAIHSTLLTIGQQYKEYFIEIAEALGYTITIDEFTPFWAGIRTAGDPCGDLANLFYWRVNIDTTDLTSSKLNISVFESRLQRLKPGHTHLLFRFTGYGFSSGFSNGFESIPWNDNAWPGLDFDPGFSNGFENNVDYNGIALVGGFTQGFNIGFDRYSGGGFTDGFTQGFERQN